MKILLDPKKKEITITAQGSETELFSLIVAFAGDAVIYPKTSPSFFKSFTNKIFSKLIIDMTHENISKEFIQMLLRSKNVKTI